MKAIWIDNITPLEVYIVPDSAIVSRGNPFFVPDDGEIWESAPTLAAVIDRLGMHIAEKFADRYYERIAIVSHQRRARITTPYEWLRDGAVVSGEPFAIGTDDLEVTKTTTDDEQLTESTTVSTASAKAIFNNLIAQVSQFMTLKSGDMIIIGDKASDLLPFRPEELRLHRDTIFTVNNRQALKLKIR